MAASQATVEKIVGILIEEVGLEKTKVIVARLIRQVPGNQSFEETLLKIAKTIGGGK